MRVGVLGDIHGNALALESVLTAAREEGLERLLITGDFVGYYYHPGRVFSLLDEWRYDAVQGNHDALLPALIETPELAERFRRRFGRGLDLAIERLAPEMLDALTSLPPRRDFDLAGRRVLLCHGTPWDRDTYLYPDAPEAAFRQCAEEQADVICMGHTHHPKVRTVGRTLLVNPGAVGQPRDGDPRASWALLDLAGLQAEIRRVSYPAARVAAEARQVDPSLPYLADVLLRDRRARDRQPS